MINEPRNHLHAGQDRQALPPDNCAGASFLAETGQFNFEVAAQKAWTTKRSPQWNPETELKLVWIRGLAVHSSWLFWFVGQTGSGAINDSPEE